VTSTLMVKLRQELAAMSELVENAVNVAIMALIERSAEMAGEVIADDDSIDEMELEVEKRCVEILQLEQPKSDNFRFVIAANNINSHLSRMGDLAVSVARNVNLIVTKSSVQADLSSVAEMLEFTSMMVRDSVISLLERNVELAWRVCAHDVLVDEALDSLAKQLYEVMESDAAKARRATWLLLCARDLEWIGNLATDIAQEVIYMLEGKIVRHHIEEWRKRLAPELDRQRASRKRRHREL
jgi:phosphate transport system protein